MALRTTHFIRDEHANFPTWRFSLSVSLHGLAFAAVVALIGVSGVAYGAKPTEQGVQRIDPALDSLISSDAKVEKVASGFGFTEGPVWKDGALWFSDVFRNVIQSVTPAGEVGVVLRAAGGLADPAPKYAGSNGMIVTTEGDVLIAQHGARRIVKLNKDASITPYITQYDGKRLNSPNDMAYHPDGSLYFTDPPYGLPKGDEDPAKDLPYSGIFRFSDGKVQLVNSDLSRPNGVAVSPDGRVLYVANSGPKMLWMRYEVAQDGTLRNGRVLANVTDDNGAGPPDGLKVDEQGNVWASGPGGVWIFSPNGTLLGRLRLPEVVANLTWATDSSMLYMTGSSSIYRVRTAVRSGAAAPKK